MAEEKFPLIVVNSTTGSDAAIMLNDLGTDGEISFKRVSSLANVPVDISYYITGTIIYSELEKIFYRYDGTNWQPYSEILSQNTNFDHIQFDTTPSSSGITEGLTYWNTDSGTLNLGMVGGNTNLKIGQESLIRVKNGTLSTINKGNLVYIVSGDTSKSVVDLAKANSESTSSGTIAMATESISGGQWGYASVFGLLTGVDTHAYTLGAQLYLDWVTAGAFTDSKPVAPNHLVAIGTVVASDATAGAIHINIRNSFELSEIHDVQISTPLNNDILTYETATSLWKNKPPLITGSGVAEQVTVWNGTNSITGDADFTFAASTNTVGVDNIRFDLTPTPTGASEALMYWNSAEGTLNLGMPGGNVNLQIGQEILRKVKNSSGADMHNGNIVYISGSTGANLEVTLASADSAATWCPRTLYMLTEDIDNGHHGYVTWWGDVRDVNTDGIADGSVLWLDPNTPGAWTATKPTAPDWKVKIGGVLKEGLANGIVTMSQYHGGELNDNKDVEISSPATNSLLTYNAGGYWTDSGYMISGTGTLALNITAGKTLTLASAGDYTLTVPATGTAALGSGAATQVVYWSGINNVSGTDLFTWSGANLSIAGDTSSRIYLTGKSGTAALEIYNYSNTAGIATALVTRRARGTSLVPLATQAGDTLFSIANGGYTGSGFNPLRHWEAQASENWSVGSNGTQFVFSTTPNGSASYIQRLHITNAGNVGIGTASFASVSGRLHIVGSVAATIQNIVQGAASQSAALVQHQDSTAAVHNQFCLPGAASALETVFNEQGSPYLDLRVESDTYNALFVHASNNSIVIMSDAAGKIGFWGATAIVQPTTAIAAATFVQGSGNAINDASTFDGYTLLQVVKALRNVGLLA